MTSSRYPVGVSSYGDGSSTSPRGQVQHVSTLSVAQQVASLSYEFDTQFPGAHGRGDRLTVNEGIREKARMQSLRAAWETFLRYGAPWAALAAALYFSTHREEIGNALDFGITQKDGSNRAMTLAESQWVHDHGPRRGIVWTGRLFSPQERWHHNGGYAAAVAPIKGVNQPGVRLFTEPKPAPPKGRTPRMWNIWDNAKAKCTLVAGDGRTYAYADFKVGKQTIGGRQQVDLINRVINSDQTKDYPVEFLPAEISIIKTILGKLK